MSRWDEFFENECKNIKEERDNYPLKHKGICKFFSYIAALFFFAGWICLALIPFTEITLLQATCLFVIGYVVEPTDGDRYEPLVKGMAEDLGYLRANITTIKALIASKE